jgi:PIN domain nuclease of toxin-antitoxin system
MKVLLDTHTLLWATLSPSSLTELAAGIIENESNSIWVSAASAWEIATKVRIGKLPEAIVLEREFLETIELAGYSLLPIEVADGLRAGRLAGDNRDPFDRMIAAQALARDWPILSKDPALDAFGVRRIW